MNLATLRQQYASCQRCPLLCKGRKQVVFGSGNPHAEILLLGEAPGAEEDRQGIPFCGAAGKVLDELLSSAGLRREEVFITNTILCRPEGNRNPLPEEVDNCRERLDILISLLQPKVVVTIGNFATERILGRKGITVLRGKVFPLMLGNLNVRVVPVIHPANYLYQGRNPLLLEQMKGDFGNIAKLLSRGTVQRKQKRLLEF